MSVKISVHVVGLARPDSPRESSCARFIGADDTVDGATILLFYVEASVSSLNIHAADKS